MYSIYGLHICPALETLMRRYVGFKRLEEWKIQNKCMLTKHAHYIHDKKHEGIRNTKHDKNTFFAIIFLNTAGCS